MGWPSTIVLLGSAMVFSAAAFLPARADDTVFRSVLDGSVLDVTPKPGEVETDAVREFKALGRNPYNGDAAAVTEGRRLYQARCQGCHLRDGKGGLGPSLVTDEPLYFRLTTDVGLFEIIYGGASGAMQPFAKQGLRQENILKVMAYLRSLRSPHSSTDHISPFRPDNQSLVK
jgi:cytochrome c-L